MKYLDFVVGAPYEKDMSSIRFATSSFLKSVVEPLLTLKKIFGRANEAPVRLNASIDIERH